MADVDEGVISRRSALAGISLFMAGCSATATESPSSPTTAEPDKGWVLRRDDCAGGLVDPVTLTFETDGTAKESVTVPFGERFYPDGLVEGKRYMLRLTDADGLATALGSYRYNGRSDVELTVSRCSA